MSEDVVTDWQTLQRGDDSGAIWVDGNSWDDGLLWNDGGQWTVVATGDPSDGI